MPKAQSSKHEHGDLTVWEYATDSENLSIARGVVNGRFPEKGRHVNTICEEMYYVMGGTGKLFIEDEVIELARGDVYLIKPNKAYYVEGEQLDVLLPTYPKWTQEQSNIVE